MLADVECAGRNPRGSRIFRRDGFDIQPDWFADDGFRLTTETVVAVGNAGAETLAWNHQITGLFREDGKATLIDAHAFTIHHCDVLLRVGQLYQTGVGHGQFREIGVVVIDGVVQALDVENLLLNVMNTATDLDLEIEIIGGRGRCGRLITHFDGDGLGFIAAILNHRNLQSAAAFGDQHQRPVGGRVVAAIHKLHLLRLILVNDVPVFIQHAPVGGAEPGHIRVVYLQSHGVVAADFCAVNAGDHIGGPGRAHADAGQ